MNIKSSLFLVFIINLILFSTLYPSIVYADEIDEEILSDSEFSEIIESSFTTTNEPQINSKSAIVLNRVSKEILYEKNCNDIRSIASTTKIMTAIIVLENSNLTDVVNISKKAANTGGSKLKLNTDDKISVNDLLYGLMLRSGNDAAVALAEHVSGNIENFCLLMNSKASELGLKNTHFATPHGLDNPEHYSTAYELALITDYALQNNKFAEIVNSKSYTISINNSQRTIYNTNELLGNLPGINGVKTGFTGNAMRCLVTSCTRDNSQIITVVLGADTKKDRTLDSKKLIEYIFNNYSSIDLENIAKENFLKWKEINLNRIHINKSQNKKIDLVLSNIYTKTKLIMKEKQKDIYVDINCIYNLQAPINKNTKIGTLSIKCKDEVIESFDILISNNVKRKSFKDYMYHFLENFPTVLDF